MSCANVVSKCAKNKIGYRDPKEASQAAREKIIYVTCLPAAGNPSLAPDYVATVDVDPDSETYCQVMHRCFASGPNQEFHHSGWNTCSSCKDTENRCRDKFFVPCLHSNHIYVYNVNEKEKYSMKLFKIITNLADFDASAPHTIHCTPDGDVLVSCMGDAHSNGKGSLLRIDGETCEIKGHWTSQPSAFGYAFWYKPAFNVLISTEWGAPKAWKDGFRLKDFQDNKYGQSLNIYEFATGLKTQTIDLGEQGKIPLEVKFMHESTSEHGYVVCAYGGTIFHVHRKKDDLGQFVKIKNQSSNAQQTSVMYEWDANCVIKIDSVQISGFGESELKAILTDFIISMDDQWMYISNWTHGQLLQYSLLDPEHPQLVSTLNLGGTFVQGSFFSMINNSKNGEVQLRQNEPIFAKNKKIRGGPQMLQLSLDGQRLYVSNSLHSRWDLQFFPDVYYQGAQIYLIQTDIQNSMNKSKMKIDPNFLVDFGEENPPALAHEVRYPGGDCTSEIW